MDPNLPSRWISGRTWGLLRWFWLKKCDVPANQQRLIYKGRILKDDNSLESYGLQSDHTVHLVRGSSASASATVATEGNTVTSNSTAGPARGVSSSNNGGFGGSGLGSLLFPGLGANGLGGNGSRGIFVAGLPEFQQAQQQLTQNPNMIREMMNMAAIQNLMNNPNLMRNLIMSNPQMREIINRNPNLAHILNDPVYLATKKMSELQVNSVVVTSGNKPQGILTSKDVLMRVAAQNLFPELTHVEKLVWISYR